MVELYSVDDAIKILGHQIDLHADIEGPIMITNELANMIRVYLVNYKELMEEEEAKRVKQERE